MKVPSNAVRHDLKTSTIWISEEGIVYSESRPTEKAQTREVMDEAINEFKTILGNKKVCLIIESNNNTPPPKEHRDYIAEQLNSISKAMAIITTSALNKMIANLFFGLKPPAYPAKMFTKQEEAEEWIRQYL